MTQRDSNRPDRPSPSTGRCADLAAACIFAAAILLLAGQTASSAEPSGAAPKTEKKAEQKPAKKPAKDPYAWQKMFDGKTLKGWKVPNFGGQGDVQVEEGALVMEMGDPMTGITWTGPLPKSNYEVYLEAKRTQGGDFFATTTFPVGDEHCSFVVGGWAGTVVGISCVDWYDASDNITSDFMAFKDDQWYRIRIRVTDEKIECWIDDDQMVDLERKGHKFMVRDEVELCRPFGICTYITEGHVRNVRIRRLKTAADDAKARAGQELFDGKSLGKWKVADKYDFSRHGKVHVTGGNLVLEAGASGTGVTWTGDFPKIDYEVTLEGKRVAGGDFFCGMTFPVDQSHLTLVLGGWGGTVTGLSSIDGEPAIENETCGFEDFELDTWYRIRLRVTGPKIEAWIDDKQIVDLTTEDRKFTIYWEMEPMTPFGIATWATTGALRKIRVRPITP